MNICASSVRDDVMPHKQQLVSLLSLSTLEPPSHPLSFISAASIVLRLSYIRVTVCEKHQVQPQLTSLQYLSPDRNVLDLYTRIAVRLEGKKKIVQYQWFFGD